MSVKVEIDAKQYARINKILNMVPQVMQFAAYDKALKPAAQVVQKRAEELAPRSSATQSRKKMSKKSQAIWSARPTATLLRVKMIKGNKRRSAFALVGPLHPDGNKANFVHPMTAQVRRRKYWGRDGKNAPSVTPKDNDFLKRAADETRSEQLRAFTRALIPAIRKSMRDLASGN